MSNNTSSIPDKHASNPDVALASAQAQMLLIALRKVVIPIAQSIEAVNVEDTDQESFGPEAQEFLVALQKLVASIIRSQAPAQQDKSQIYKENTAEILDRAPALSSRKEDERTISRRDDVDTNAIVSPESMAALGNPSSGEESSTAVVSSIGVPISLKQPEILTKTLSVLRQHVFDTMPIRLLRFGTCKSKFDIALVEREQIYAELARQIQTEFDDNIELGNINDMVSRIARYSILSHTWLRGAPGEVTYDNWLKGDFDTEQPGYQKLANFCKAAADHGFTFGWMDTVCINKASSAELDESIRSMYKWYGKANICIIYLAATTNVSGMDTDPWFTRGWTLQELVAPEYLKFYNMNWNKLMDDSSNDKVNSIILQNIESASMISHDDMAALAAVPISRKMQWAGRREVTRGEDAAYSLMGIFNVNMSIAYGEGAEQAFLRLLKEILNTATKGVIDIFNWAGEYETNNLPLLPSSPKAYLHSYPAQCFYLDRPMEPLTVTHLGLRIPVVIMLGEPTNNPASPYDSIGEFHATVNIQPSMPDVPHSYNILDKNLFSISRINQHDRIAFAILNCPGNETMVYIPKTCFAVAIMVNDDTGDITSVGYKQKISTKEPVVFELFKAYVSDSEMDLPHYVIRRTMLGYYRIQQINMVL